MKRLDALLDALHRGGMRPVAVCRRTPCTRGCPGANQVGNCARCGTACFACYPLPAIAEPICRECADALGLPVPGPEATLLAEAPAPGQGRTVN